MRTLVIGDIHGGYKSLIQCLERSKFDKKNDTLIVLGDVADGWPETLEVVEELLTIKNLIPILGNHDKWVMDWMGFGESPNLWLNQGGKATFYSYLGRDKIRDKHYKKYFSKCHLYYIDDKNRGFVHGGFTSKKGLGYEPYETNYYWDRDLWELANSLHFTEIKKEDIHDQYFRPNPHRMYKHKEIFIGHTSTNYWEVKPHYPEYKDDNQPKNGPIVVPMNRCNIWNLDTGGGYKGKLTIMDVDTKQYWQSDLLDVLYPNIKGR